MPPSFKAETHFFRRERLPKIRDLIEQSFSAFFLLTAELQLKAICSPASSASLRAAEKQQQLQNNQLTCINNWAVGWEEEKTLGFGGASQALLLLWSLHAGGGSKPQNRGGSSGDQGRNWD